MSQPNVHGIWSSRWTFILAATGSAVGLGNIWKFPYITGENGGGAFVLVYLMCIALVGIPIMLAEVLLGRKGRHSPINTMRLIAQHAGLSKIWVVVGWSGVVAGLCILAFYSVVASWILDYIFATASGTFEQTNPEKVGAYFGEVRGDIVRVLAWHTIFILLNVVVVASGVTRGLAMVARVLMPLLFVMLLALLAYGIVQGEFLQAVKFLFNFRFSELSGESILVAMGHAFFTLSLGMGAIMAYGAYMPRNASLGKTVVTVGVLDTLVALIAGLAIFPIVFASNIEPGSGPGLLFVSLPVAFGNMSGGLIFGVLFFVLVTVAAWSSAVSLIEPGVAWLVETKSLGRIGAAISLGFVAWCGGVASAYSSTVFDFFDVLTAQFMLPLGGLLIALFVGWFLKREVIEKEMDSDGHPLMDIWLFILRYVSPLLVLWIFIVALKDKFA